MKQYFAILLVLISIQFEGFSQGLIINEFSNGPSGTQEWIELLVIGDSAFPTATVNLIGYILDDNGGNFEASTGGVGIADGHIKFGNAFNAIPPGAIIVIYNEGSKAANIPLDDPVDANNDSVYILAGNHSSLQACSSVPVIGTFSYSCTPTSSQWNYVGLRNGGDAIQIRTPLNQLYHGFSYGDVTAPFPLFPSSVSSWNIGNGGTGLAYEFDCGDWEVLTSFNEINESVSTPGFPNTGNNNNFIAKLRNGTFNYDSLHVNCSSTVVNPPPVIDTAIPLPKINIPNVFSPNKDGNNDVFIIDSLLYYDVKDFAIYNRWGKQVYRAINYQNNWNGNTNDGDELSQGTYYYILDIGEKKKRTGFISLFR